MIDTKLNLLTTIISIDTSIFVKECFKFTKGNLKTLQTLCETNEISIIISEIVLREVEIKIQEMITEEYNKLKKARYLTDISHGLKLKEMKYYIEKRLQEFNAFLTKTKAEIISVSSVNPGIIFNDYFSKSGAFQNKDKEFPDAFSIESLREWSVKNDKVIYVISNDNDFYNHCLLRNDYLWFKLNLIPLKSISDFLDLYYNNHNQSTNILEITNLLYDKYKTTLEKEIKKNINVGTFDFPNIDNSINEILPTHISINDKKIINSTESQISIEVIFDFNVIMSNLSGLSSFQVSKSNIISYLCSSCGTARITFDYNPKAIGKNKIVSVTILPQIKSQDTTYKEIDINIWPENTNVIVIGVKNGEITNNPNDCEAFEDFFEAKKVYKDLDPYESNKTFTAAMGRKYIDSMRFETWKVFDFYST